MNDRLSNVALKLTSMRFRCEEAGENSYSSSSVKVLDGLAA